MESNPLTAIDFYKADHRPQYPEDTSLVYGNFTPRSAKHAPVLPKYFDDRVVFFGLQGIIKSFLIDTWNDKFFNMPKNQVVAKYARRMDTSLGEGTIGIEHIKALHDLGFLPIQIKALPEGSRVNIGIPMFTIQNTLPEFFWLTNYLETVLSAMVWKSCTTATIANEYHKIMLKYAEDTGSPKEFIPFQCHDFSMRGMSGLEDAARSSAGHLLSFVGTDTIPAIDYMEDYYYADAEKELIGTSVPATEHSVMCMGTKDGEIETIRRLINDLYPTGIISIVSDTWDFWKVLTEYLPILKDEIMARQPNALGMNKVVIRPDSGDPVDIICGTALLWDADLNAYTYQESRKKNKPYILHNDEYYIATLESLMLKFTKVAKIDVPAEVKGAVECLWETFNGTETEKGFKILDQHIGLIYGDSITLERADEILSRLKAKGFAASNIVFGVGSYTYQYLTRDTFGFAMKATYGVVNGEPREIFKDPATDDGTKKSAKGLLKVTRGSNGYLLQDSVTRKEEKESLLTEVFLDGWTSKQTLSEIRARLQEE